MYRPETILLPPPGGATRDGVRLVHWLALEPEPSKTALARHAGTVAAALGEAEWEFHLPTLVVRHRVDDGELRQVAVPRSRRAEIDVRDGDVLVCCQLPAGGALGNTGTSVLSLFATLALAVAASAIAGPAGAAFFGSQLLATAAAAAVTVGGAYLISTYLKQDTKDTTTSTSLYDFSPSGNQYKIWDPVPVLYGRNRTQPSYAAPAYSEYDGDDVFTYQLFCLGCGDYFVEELQMSDTAFWTSSGGIQSGFEDMAVQIAAPGEEVTLFPWDVAVSSEVRSIGVNTDTNFIGPYVANGAGTLTNELAVDFQFPNGIGGTDTSGNTITVYVGVEAQAQEIDDAGNVVGDWFDLVNETFSGSTSTKPMRYTRKYDVPPARYRVRFRRTTDPNNQSTVRDSLTWVSLRAYIYNGPQAFTGVTTIAVKVKATENLQSSSGQTVSVISTRKLPIYFGGVWFAPEATRSRAWAAADILANGLYGAGLTDAEFSLDTLTTLEGTWNAREEYCDTVFDTQTTVFEALSTVLKGGRAFPVLVGGKIDFERDEPHAVRRIFFTDRNIVRGSLSAEYTTATEDTPDDVIVEFIDNRTWKASEVRCTLPGSDQAKPTRVTEKTITDRDNAWRYGMYAAADHRYRRKKYTFKVEWEGKFIRRGTPCRMATDLLDYQSAAIGSVVGYDGSYTVTVDFDPPWGSGSTHYARLRDRMGKDWGPISIAPGAGPRDILLSSSDVALVASQTGTSLAGVLADSNQEPTHIAHLFGTPFTRECKVYSVVPDGPHQATITLVEDHPNVYTADGTGTVPGLPDAPPSTGLLTSSPVISGLSAWRQQEDVVCQLYASWYGAPGAFLYEAQISYDAQATWTGLWSGGSTSFSSTTSSPEAYLRVRGVGRLAGPWIVWHLPQIILETIDPTLAQKIAAFNARITAEVQAQFDAMDAIFADLEHWQIVTMDVLAGTTLQWDDHWTKTDEIRQELQTQVGNANAAITDESTTRASENAAMASRVTTVEANVGANTASITTETTARVQGDQALSSQLVTLTVRVTSAEGSIRTEQQVRASQDNIFAGQITTINTTVGQHSATLQVYGTSINGLQVQYGVTGTINGYTGGFMLTGIRRNDGQVLYGMEFHVDYFRVSAPDYGIGTSNPIFQIGYYGGFPKIGIRSDVYLDGTLNARAIVAGTITGILIRADEIITDHIKAGNITTIVYNSGYNGQYITTQYGNVLFTAVLRFTWAFHDAGGLNMATAYATIYRDGFAIKSSYVQGPVLWDGTRYLTGFNNTEMILEGIDFIAGAGGTHLYTIGVSVDSGVTVTYDAFILMENKR